MSLFIDTVEITLTGEEANAIYRAVDRFAAGRPDGPQRAMLDRLNVKVANAIRVATLAEEAKSEQRGAAALAALDADLKACSDLVGRLDARNFDRRSDAA